MDFPKSKMEKKEIWEKNKTEFQKKSNGFYRGLYMQA